MNVVPHVKFGQGEGVIRIAGHSAKSVQNDCEEGQQGTFEERIRLVVSRLPLERESSKPPELSAEWMVINVQQTARKLSAAVQS
jgi:hypothetical protein